MGLSRERDIIPNSKFQISRKGFIIVEREALLRNIEEWRERVAEASARWGGAEICGVSKTVDPETVNMAWDGGIRTLGENRVQELLGKLDRLNPEFRYIIDKVDMIQSLDREALADEIQRRAAAAGVVMPVLVQVNIAREPQKAGIDEDGLEAFVRRLSGMDGLRVEGLMAIMPFVDDPETVRPYFRRMREWFERLRDMDIPNVRMNTLSMGMSGDCLVACQEGATMVRLGRALFGERSYH